MSNPYEEAPVPVRSNLLTYTHGFSTRCGGVSEGIFATLNLGMTRGDDPEKVKENYRRFLSACGIGQKAFVCGNQVHGNHVMIVGAQDAREPYGYDELFMADGYVTAEAGVPLVIFTADCIPLLMEDPKAGVVAAVHSGWRSTVLDIERNAIDAMVSLGASKSNIRACIGPAICRNCFEVGSEVIEEVEKLLQGAAGDFYDKKDNGKFMLDLKGVVKRCLMNTGLLEENIDVIPDCTLCLPEKYWSHRYTGGNRGSQASVIMKSV
ncbi:MAG: peptidoglycan editing factor PgeF [Lachnospiraceae bacterium]|nr:peptidoglycan editing factor PgeF [Lachnospiraceae bacterium]